MASTSAHAMVKEALDQAELRTVGEDEPTKNVARLKALLEVSQTLALHVDALTYSLSGLSGDNKRTPLSKSRGIDKVPTFSGTRTDFPEWTKQVGIFLSDFPDLRLMLKEVKKDHFDKIIDDEILEELRTKHNKTDADIQWYSSQVHDVLMMVTSGVPHSFVDNCNENGFEAWRQLHAEYASVTPQGKRSLLGLVLNSKKAK